MASLGNITVELDLNDKNFTIKTIRAGKTVRALSNNFDQSTKSIKRMERSITGILPRLRDIAITASILKGGISNLYHVTLGWQKSIIDTNANIERMTFLLKGMSTATTELGRNQEAAKNLEFLFDMAERAPFSLNEVTNSFVKMKSVGLDDVNGAVKSLTDSVAQFGGTDEVLHRATVAIQQMAGKGVISMEELRQQLGEAVPTAIKLMARSMSMTYQELVDAISSGRVEANDALQRMLREMDRTMGGAGLLMMDTWSGMVSRMETRWTKFQVAIGDNKMFDEAKKAIGLVIDELDPNKVAHYAEVWGQALASIINGLTKTAKYLMDHGGQIVDVAEKVGFIVLAWKSASIIGAILTGLSARMAILTAATTAATMSSGRMAGVLGGQALAMTTTSSAAAFLTATLVRLRTAVTWMLGPWGKIAAVVLTAAAAYFSFNSEADKAAEIMANGTKAIGENTQEVLKNAIATKEAEEARLRLAMASRAEVRDEQEDTIYGLAARDRAQGDIDKLTTLLQAAAKERSDMQKRLHDGLYKAEQNHASNMVSLLERDLAKRNKNIISAYSSEIEASAKLYDAGKIGHDEFIEQRQDAMRKEYDGLISVAKTKMKEVQEALSDQSAESKDKAGYRKQIEALQKEITRLIELKAMQIQSASEQVNLLDKPGNGSNSRLVNFINTVESKSASSRAEINGLNGEVEKFMRLLKSGTFGKEGETLLGGGLVNGKTLPQFKEAILLQANLADEEREFIKLKREEESAIDALTKKSRRLAQEAKTASAEFASGVDNSFVDRINREIDELLGKVNKADANLMKLAETARDNAIKKATLSNATSQREETRKITNSLMSDRKRALVEYEQAVKEAKSKIVKTETMTAAEITAIDTTLVANLLALQEQYARDSETPMQKMLREWEDSTGKMQKASARWLDDSSSRLADFVTGGKLGFKDFAESIINDLIKIQIQSAMSGMFSAGGGLGGLFGGGGGSAALPAGGGSIHTTAGAAGSAGGGFLSAIGSMFSFADGGVMSSMGKAYASGGIANSPQLALFGEGSMSEAFVPLPDGKSIPVTMSGGGGSSVSIQINVDNSGNESTDESGKESGVWSAMADRVKGVVRDELVTNQRPGGLLYK